MISTRSCLRRKSLPIAILAVSLLQPFNVAPVFGQAAPAATQSLPSGLTPVSQVAVGDSQLALDSNGTLFRQDHGKSWKPVRQQWNGKAVELLGVPGLAQANSQPAFAAVLLKSTASLHWVSVDKGKTWTLSDLDDVRRNDVKWSGE